VDVLDTLICVMAAVLFVILMVTVVDAVVTLKQHKEVEE
jgi:hypothetical protein